MGPLKINNKQALSAGLFLTSTVSNLILPPMLRRAVLVSTAFGQKYEASGFVPGDKLLLNSGF